MDVPGLGLPLRLQLRFHSVFLNRLARACRRWTNELYGIGSRNSLKYQIVILSLVRRAVFELFRHSKIAVDEVCVVTREKNGRGQDLGLTMS